MARDLMPKSGIMMPHVVVTRDAAVVGVSTVDGFAGAVDLTDKYLQKTDASATYQTKAEGASKTYVLDSIQPIMEGALFKADPFVDNNIPFRSAGANGVESVDMIKVTPENSIKLGSYESSVQGVEIHSAGRVVVVDKNDAGVETKYPVYSKRYRPEIGDLPFAAIGSYVKDSKGRTIGVNRTGINSDIKSLSGLTSISGMSPNLELRGVNSGEGHGNGVIYESSDPVEASFGIANIGGGSAVFHNYTKPADGSGIENGVLIGGYGSRPWTGTAYTAHSNVSQHFLMDGKSSSTNHGGWFRLLTTPLNKTDADRRQTFATSNNGDMYAGFDVPMGMYSLSKFDGFAGMTNLDGRGFKQINNTTNEISLITPRNGATANINFRGVAFDGSMTGAKGSTQQGDNMWLSFSGHNGSHFTNAAAGIRIQASSGWSTTNQQCGITIATTPPGSTTRVDRWNFTSDGSLSPASDNVYHLGSSISRCAAIWSANGTIQTSDARMKTAVRPLTDAELSAASAIAKEIGFFRWLERVEVEGDAARIHAGITVQRVMDILTSYGLDPMHYGFVCYDAWEEQSVLSPDPDDDAKSTVTITPAGDRYSLRYAELSMFLARGMEQRISELEEKLSQ